MMRVSFFPDQTVVCNSISNMVFFIVSGMYLRVGFVPTYIYVVLNTEGKK